jgi:uncharacterized membrane protein YqjE
VSEHGLRTALAEHLDAYADLLSASSRMWGAQFARRALAFVVAAVLALLLLIVIVFIVLLVSWPTPYRWWVVGGVVALLTGGVVWGLVVARGALRQPVPAPWTLLAEELSTDLRGRGRNDE